MLVPTFVKESDLKKKLCLALFDLKSNESKLVFLKSLNQFVNEFLSIDFSYAYKHTVI